MKEDEKESRENATSLAFITTGMIVMSLVIAVMTPGSSAIDLDLTRHTVPGGEPRSVLWAWDLVAPLVCAPWRLVHYVGSLVFTLVTFVPRAAGEAVLAACLELGVPLPMWVAAGGLVAGTMWSLAWME